ncbi:MAG: hypothetical protein KDI78_12615 [Xanthomonadales bacterium]|nr:hypothetical protein [Xanthomonadales bacterium]
MSIKHIAATSLLISALSASALAIANPLNISLSDATPDPVFIGHDNATFAIHIEPTITGGTVTGLSGNLGPLSVYGGLQLVGHDCPGTLTRIGSDFQWSGVPDLNGGASIDCSIELLPTTPATLPVEMRLNMACDGCSADADDRDSGLLTVVLAPDVVATISTNAYPSVGAADLTVVLRNDGEATAWNIPVSLYGTASLFSTMTPTGAGKCTGTTSSVDSVDWTVVFLDPGEQLNCPFTFTVPGTGSYSLNLAAPSETDNAVPEPDLADNYDSVTLNATSLVVNTQTGLADASPGDGVCADTNGFCGVRAAVEEANALAGHQVISVPYSPITYFANNLVITETVTISGVPDSVSGDYPVITRTSSQNTPLFRIQTATPSQTILEKLDLRGNSAVEATNNGGVVLQFNGGLWIRDARVSEGWTIGNGGGVYGTEGLRLTNVEIFDNIAKFGGGLYVLGTANNGVKDAIIEAVAFHDNHAIDNSASASGGGGAYFINADTDIRKSSFVDNDAERGGGVMVSTGAAVLLENSTVSSNEATLYGGGIFHLQGNLLVNFSTIVYNAAGPGDNNSGDGGGIWSDGGIATDIRNSILAYNTARTVGGTAFGTVVSGNCHGTLDSAGWNTIAWIAGDPDCTSAGLTGEDDYDVAPSLAALATTAGGVGFHRLTRVNQEIDQATHDCDDGFGHTTTQDILGWPRPQEGDGHGEALCDRGAVESIPVSLHISTSDSGPAAWQILVDGDRPACLEPQCSYYYIPVGSQVTLTPDVSPGTAFNGWSGDCAGTGNCVLQMSEARNVSASFSSVGHTLNVSKTAGGNVSSSPAGISCGADCSEIYSPGTEVTLTANPAVGWVLQNWTGDCTGGGACVVTMDAARSVHAIFNVAWTLDVSVVGSGSVVSSPAGIACPGDCNEDYADGAEVTLTPTPDPGFDFDHWSGDCSGSGACVVQIDQTRNVTAHFVANTTDIYANGFE